MNIRQFLNALVCMVVEKTPVVRQSLLLFPQFFFPEFLRCIRFNARRTTAIGVATKAYVFVFVLVFVIQAILSLANGVLMPDKDTGTRHFFEDYENIANYIIFVEGYCIAGLLFLFYSISIEEQFQKSELVSNLPMQIDASPELGGYVSAFIVAVAPLLSIACYGVSKGGQTLELWYMAAGRGPLREYAWN